MVFLREDPNGFARKWRFQTFPEISTHFVRDVSFTMQSFNAEREVPSQDTGRSRTEPAGWGGRRSPREVSRSDRYRSQHLRLGRSRGGSHAQMMGAVMCLLELQLAMHAPPATKETARYPTHVRAARAVRVWDCRWAVVSSCRWAVDLRMLYLASI